MFTAQNYLNVLPAAESLASKRIALVANSNTPLEVLFNLIPSYAYEGITEFNYRDCGEQIASVSNDDSAHHNEQSAYIEQLAKLVTGHISHAKNTVKPIVLQFSDMLKKYLEDNQTRSPSSEIEIVSKAIPELLLDDSFLDTIKPYENTSVVLPNIVNSFSLKPKTEEQLKQLMSTGADRTNKLMNDWLLRQEPGFVTKIYGSFFNTTMLTEKDFISAEKITSLNPVDSSNYSLALLLICRNIYDNVQDVVGEPVSLKVYQAYIYQLIQFAGSVLCNSLYKIKSYIGSKTLVLGLDSKLKKINVLEPVYLNWLDKGGSTEVLFGLFIADSSLRSEVLINESAEKLKAQWQSYTVFYNNNEAAKKFDYYKAYLVRCLDLCMQELTEEEQKISQFNPNFYANIKKLADSEIDKLKPSDMENVDAIALTLIAKCRFHYTSSYDILNDINEVGRINPNVDVREAATLAAINYLSKYMACQMTGKRI